MNYDINQRWLREEEDHITYKCRGIKLWGKFHVLQDNNVIINEIYP